MNGLFGGRKAEVIDATKQPDIECDAFDREVLLQHAALGCDSLWCVASGQASPFVFRPRLVKGRIPCAQLIYCRDVGDFVRFAGPIGRFLGRRGKFFVVIDANGPVPGLVGWFQPEDAEVLQGAAAPASRRSGVHRVRVARRLNPQLCARRRGPAFDLRSVGGEQRQRQAIHAEGDAPGIDYLPAAIARFQALPKWSR